MQPPDQPAPGEPPQFPPAGSTPPSAPSTPPPYPESSGASLSKDEKTWAMAAHLSSLVGYLVLPFGNIIAPLIIWLIKKDTMPFVDDQAKEALNFQITLTIVGLIGFVLAFILIGIPILAAVWIMGIVLSIVAAVKANEGVRYRYPATLRLVA